MFPALGFDPKEKFFQAIAEGNVAKVQSVIYKFKAVSGINAYDEVGSAQPARFLNLRLCLCGAPTTR